MTSPQNPNRLPIFSFRIIVPEEHCQRWPGLVVCKLQHLDIPIRVPHGKNRFASGVSLEIDRLVDYKNVFQMLRMQFENGPEVYLPARHQLRGSPDPQR